MCYAIKNDEPPGIIETSLPDAVDLYEKWERCNRLSMTFIKANRSAGIRGLVDQHTKVKDLLRAIDEQFVTSGLGSQASQKGICRIPPQDGIKKEVKCFFCKKRGHMKNRCLKFQNWLEKKGYAKPKEASG